MQFRNKSELNIVQEKEIKLIKIMDCLAEKRQTVYVLNAQEKLCGIITRGDMLRYLKGKQDVPYNTCFTYSSRGDMVKAQNTFVSHPSIYEIPVVEEGVLIGEYYIEGKTDESGYMVMNPERLHSHALDFFEFTRC